MKPKENDEGLIHPLKAIKLRQKFILHASPKFSPIRLEEESKKQQGVEPTLQKLVDTTNITDYRYLKDDESFISNLSSPHKGETGIPR